MEVVSPFNAHIFQDYVLERLETLTARSPAKPSPLVRATYASCIASLALTASRFLDMMQALRADGALPTGDPEVEEGGLRRSV